MIALQEWMPMRMRISGSPSALNSARSFSMSSCISHAARHAWTACFGSSSGAPHIAMIASPMKRFTVPSWRLMIAVARVKWTLRILVTCSAPSCSVKVVKPARSVKSIVTSRLSPPRARRSGCAITWSTTSGDT